MTVTLHDSFVPTALQTLGAMQGLLGRAEQWAGEHGREPAMLLGAKLAPDMLPLAYQFKSVAVHTGGAVEGVRAGTFGPDMTPPPANFAGVRALLDNAVALLSALNPDELNGMVGRPMEFRMGELVLPFRVETFLWSFSQPNYFFHATTAYALLRQAGVPIGKREFLGAMQLGR